MGLSSLVKRIGILCGGVRSKRDSSILNNDMTVRLPQLGVTLHCSPRKIPPCDAAFHLPM